MLETQRGLESRVHGNRARTVRRGGVGVLEPSRPGLLPYKGGGDKSMVAKSPLKP
jgi:hypothetical protein